MRRQVDKRTGRWGDKKWLGYFLFLLLLVSCGRGRGADDFEERVLFLQSDEVGMHQLFLVDLDGNAPQQLTESELGVFDFSPAPDGQQVALAWNVAAGGIEIWRLAFAQGEPQPAERLLECSSFICQNPVWASDSRRIIYERRNLQRQQPELWWLDSETGETIPVFSDKVVNGYAPALSADSRYLSFVLIPGIGTTPQLPEGHTFSDGHGHLPSATQMITIFDFETGEQTIIPNLMNSPVTWQQGGNGVLFTDMYFFGNRIAVHMLQANADAVEIVNLTRERTIEDSAPRWSPDGSQIAFTRKQASTPMGRQLWVMNADGSELRELTRNTNWHHGEPLWSADGDTLLFQRFDGASGQQTPDIYLRDVASASEVLLVEGGFRPKWLP